MVYFAFYDNEQVIYPASAKEFSMTYLCDKQCKIQDNFVVIKTGSIYLNQTYTKISKLIRDNCNVIVLFRQDKCNLHHVCDEHISPDLEHSEFKWICMECWENRCGFQVSISSQHVSDANRIKKIRDLAKSICKKISLTEKIWARFSTKPAFSTSIFTFKAFQFTTTKRSQSTQPEGLN